MKKLFDSVLGKKTGIYAILNRINNRIYVGSTTRSFNKRYSNHMSSFRQKTNSPFLQRDYDLAPQNFLMYILETIGDNKTDILNYEQKWLDFLFDGQNKCYNITPTAGNTAGIKFSDDRKANLSSKIKDRYRDPVFYMKFLARQARNRKEYSFISPENELFTGKGVEYFCSQNNLSVAHMCELLKRKIKSYKGWRCPENANYKFDVEKLCKKNASNMAKALNVSLISPDGITYSQIVNISKFCFEHGLHRVSIRKLAAGQIKQTKGWKLV